MEVQAVNSEVAKRARVSVSLFFFISGFGFSTWASRIPAIQQHLSLNEAELGGVLFALPMGLLLTLPVTGLLLGRFSSRNITLVGAICFNLIMCLLGFANRTWQVTLALFCFGSSRNLMSISVNAQSIGVQNLYDRSIIASFHGIWSLAGFAGAAVGTLMVSADISPAYHFLIVSLLLTGLSFYSFPGTLPQIPTPGKRNGRFLLPDRALFKYGLICFVAMACEGTMYDWSGIFFRKAVHASKDTVGLGYAVYMVAMTLGRFAGDRLVERFGIYSMLRYSGVLICFGLLLAALFPLPLVAALGFMMVGFGISCVVPLVFTMAGKSKTMDNGPAIASVSTVGYFGFLIVPPLVGFVAQVASLRWSFALMAALGATITWIIREPK